MTHLPHGLKHTVRHAIFLEIRPRRFDYLIKDVLVGRALARTCQRTRRMLLSAVMVDLQRLCWTLCEEEVYNLAVVAGSDEFGAG